MKLRVFHTPEPLRDLYTVAAINMRPDTMTSQIDTVKFAKSNTPFAKIGEAKHFSTNNFSYVLPAQLCFLCIFTSD